LIVKASFVFPNVFEFLKEMTK